MPPQGPPGPQAQQAPLPAAAATSTAVAAAEPVDGSDHGQHAQHAQLTQHDNHSSHNPSTLRRRREQREPDPDTGEVPCPVQGGAQGIGADNGHLQGPRGMAPHRQQDKTDKEKERAEKQDKDDRHGEVQDSSDAGGESAEPKLLTFHDVPEHLQFNPYIVTGYRPMCSFWGSVRSLFYLHNETVNIVTHGIPIVYILLVVPGLVPWSRLDRHGHFLAWCHLVGAVSPWVGSFVYHLFMNLQAGERVYNRLLRLDMFGIWICQSFGALPMVTATVYCSPWNVRWLVISSYCMLSLCGLYKAMTAWSPWDRRLSFALPWVSRLVLCVVRACLGGGSPHNMLHLILQDGVSLVGGVVGAVYFPEKYFPGMVDYCLNSHNIMHVLTVSAVYSMHCATMQDLEWIASVDCKPSGPPWPPWPTWAAQPLANRTDLALEL